MDKLARYAKGVVAAVGGVVTVVTAAVQDEAISLDEASGIWTALVALVTALGVYGIRNRDA